MRTASHLRRMLAGCLLAALLLAGLPLSALFAASGDCPMGKCACCCRRHRHTGPGWVGMPPCARSLHLYATTPSAVFPPPDLAGFRASVVLRPLVERTLLISACARRFRQLDQRPPPSC